MKRPFYTRSFFYCPLTKDPHSARQVLPCCFY